MDEIERFTYIWEFEVPASAQAEFLAHYAPGGTWTQLFKKSPHYLGTELYHDRTRPERYLSVDHWRSEAAFKSFRTRYASDFELLDHRCDALTVREASLGQFQPVGGTDVERR